MIFAPFDIHLWRHKSWLKHMWNMEKEALGQWLEMVGFLVLFVFLLLFVVWFMFFISVFPHGLYSLRHIDLDLSTFDPVSPKDLGQSRACLNLKMIGAISAYCNWFSESMLSFWTNGYIPFVSITNIMLYNVHRPCEWSSVGFDWQKKIDLVGPRHSWPVKTRAGKGRCAPNIDSYRDVND